MFILLLCRWALKKVNGEKYQSAPANCVGGDGCGKYTIELHSFFLFYTYIIAPNRVIVKV